MIKFEVTGETPEEFAMSAMQAFGLLSIGLQTLTSQGWPTKAASKPSTPANASSVEGQPARGGVTPPPPNERTSSEMFDKLDTPVMEPLENPKVLSSTPGSPTTSTTKAPKLDDLKAALAKVITSAVGRGWGMPRARAYATQLLEDFGAKKISEVREQSRSAFIGRAAYYIAGTVDDADNVPF